MVSLATAGSTRSRNSFRSLITPVKRPDGEKRTDGARNAFTPGAAVWAMRCRDLLAGAGATLLAGCVHDPLGTAGEPEARSVFEGWPCQRVFEETTCHHTATPPPDHSTVVLVPEAEELPAGDIDASFPLHNGLEGTYHFAFNWFLRRAGDRWQFLPPPDPEGNVTARRLPAGERATLALERPAVETYTAYAGEVPLGGGTFAFVVIGSPSTGPPLFASAYFRVAGGPLSLGIPAWVAIQSDGASATVRRTDRPPAATDGLVRFEVVSRSADFGTPVSPELASRRWELGVAMSVIEAGEVATIDVRTGGGDDRDVVDLLEFAATDPATGEVDPDTDYPVLSYRGTAFSATRRSDLV